MSATPRRLAAAIAVTAAITALAIAAALFVDGWGLLDFDAPGVHIAFEQFRVPRVLAAAVVGAALAGAGAAFQAVLRNPLAEPYTLGVASGSALFAVLAIRLGLDQTLLGHNAVGLAALLGALVTVYLVYTLGRIGRELPPATLLLAGITIAMFCGAATMLVQYTADFSEVYRMVRWMMGGLDGILYPELTSTAIAVAVGCAVLLYLSRDLNALAAGSDAAASVGVSVHRSVALALAASALLVGSAISIAGPIGFIGLIVPHAVRAIVGPDHRVLVPISMLAGSAAVAASDTLARLLLYPDELPVGVVTALFGGPFFLYLLLRDRNRGALWGG